MVRYRGSVQVQQYRWTVLFLVQQYGLNLKQVPSQSERTLQIFSHRLSRGCFNQIIQVYRVLYLENSSCCQGRSNIAGCLVGLHWDFETTIKDPINFNKRPTSSLQEQGPNTPHQAHTHTFKDNCLLQIFIRAQNTRVLKRLLCELITITTINRELFHFLSHLGCTTAHSRS